MYPLSIQFQNLNTIYETKTDKTPILSLVRFQKNGQKLHAEIGDVPVPKIKSRSTIFFVWNPPPKHTHKSEKERLTTTANSLTNECSRNFGHIFPRKLSKSNSQTAHFHLLFHTFFFPQKQNIPVSTSIRHFTCWWLPQTGKKSLTRKFPTSPRSCATEKQRSAVPH